MSSEDTNLDHENQYLIFSIHQELYAAPLMGVREVIEPIHIRPIPNTVDYFLGIINMRGEIIGVVDLRIRFGAICTDSPMKAMVIFESPVGPMAVVVDKIESVSTIDKTQIDFNPTIPMKISSKYLIGVGKVSDRLVIIMNLCEILGSEVYDNVRNSKLAKLA